MATVIGHTATALAIMRTFQPKRLRAAVAFMAVFLSILPDFDVIAFTIGIPYISMWGHRGFSHSIFFAVIVAFGAASIFVKITGFMTRQYWLLFTAFFSVLLSHVLLDAITNGGLGVAIWAPFSGARYFLPWRPLPVSPIALSRVVQSRGLSVLTFELYFVALPSLLYFFLITILKHGIMKMKKRKADRFDGNDDESRDVVELSN